IPDASRPRGVRRAAASQMPTDPTYPTQPGPQPDAPQPHPGPERPQPVPPQPPLPPRASRRRAAPLRRSALRRGRGSSMKRTTARPVLVDVDVLTLSG
ncbi:MAG TPA: hypothetical protein VFZ94_16590, partial [Burkholderiales bacterium]